MKKLKILFLEPFYGGSHRDFVDGLMRHSSHDISLFTLPARFWKWRMRGAALYFSETVKNPADYDVLFTSDMMSLSDLKMLWGARCPPAIVYFHENQLSYPLPDGEKMDYQFGFTDITTGLAADRLLFNSHFHMNSFFDNMPGFIGKMPEYKPHWAAKRIKTKSGVIYPGCNFPAELPKLQKPSGDKEPPLILWNHRWEFDKCPEVFFDVLRQADEILKNSGIANPFNIVILGENFQAKPKVFIEAVDHYGKRILQYGYCESKEEYHRWLEKSDIIISTAIQENFGISVIEAIRFGCIPLLPDRLSYPELIPEEYHNGILYRTEEQLLQQFIRVLQKLHAGSTISDISMPAEYFGRFSWENMITGYDEIFIKVLNGSR